ncbi:MAG TPA: hypothetical protein VFB46_11730, partial [Gemmatimonadaceae bacterium]|nr:hypothetical protein [Gemmatimonadaceae bacterium]
LRWLGVARGAAIRAAAPLLFPFTAPRACELVIGAALRDLTADAQLAALLGEKRFLRWIRPSAYDALHGGPRFEGDASPVGELVRALPRTLIERAVQAPPGNEDGRYCPRCARSYRGDTPGCYDCGGLALERR